MARFIKALIFTLMMPAIISCYIYIDGNPSRGLSADEKQALQPYVQNMASRGDFHVDSMPIWTLCPGDARSFIREQRYTWISTWVPFCRSEYSMQLPGLLMQASSIYQQEGLGMMLISTSHSIHDIRSALEKSGYDLPVFVLNQACYGTRMGKALGQFAKELDEHNLHVGKSYYGEYFFKDSLMIKAAWQFTLEEIDSLIKATSR